MRGLDYSAGKPGGRAIDAGYRSSALPERFWQKIELDEQSGCWLWTAATVGGYGVFKAGSPRKQLRAHRYSYEMLVGPIAPGLHLDHLCRVPRCVSPAHLEPVTCRVNLLRGETHAARNGAKTHCYRGHEFNAENTYVDSRGSRVCRECSRIKKRRHYSRNRESEMRRTTAWRESNRDRHNAYQREYRRRTAHAGT